jgi:hypothetical protein
MPLKYEINTERHFMNFSHSYYLHKLYSNFISWKRLYFIFSLHVSTRPRVLKHVKCFKRTEELRSLVTVLYTASVDLLLIISTGLTKNAPCEHSKTFRQNETTLPAEAQITLSASSRTQTQLLTSMNSHIQRFFVRVPPDVNSLKISTINCVVV